MVQVGNRGSHVLKVEHSVSRLLEYSTGTSFLFVYNVHSCCVRLRCAFVIYLFHTHTDVVVALLITISMYICMCVSVVFVLSFLMLHDIRSFPFAQQYDFFLVISIKDHLC